MKPLSAWWREHVAEAVPITEQEASEEPGAGHNTQRSTLVLDFFHIGPTTIGSIDLQNHTTI